MTDQDLFVLEKLFISQDHFSKVSESKEDADFLELGLEFRENNLFLSSGGTQSTKRNTFEYISNADGSIRWLWPKANKSPDFLKFYSAMSAKSMVYQFLMKIIFYIPVLRNVFIKKLSVHAGTTLYIDKLTQGKTGQYAVFTGTVGPNRKIVVYNRKESGNEFLKIPVGQTSLESITNEYRKAELFKAHLDCFEIPEIAFENSILSSSDLEIETSKSHHITNGTQESLIKIINRTIKERVIISDVLTPLETVPKKGLENLKASYNKTLQSSINESINLCLNHGDFTPWNCYQEASPVKIFDLEFASAELPVYYDAFHFWVQYLVMCTTLSFDEVSKEVKEKWENSLFSSDSKSRKIEFEHAWKSYLLFVSSHYYYVYSKQEELHSQGQKLIEYLTYSLDFLIQEKSDVTLREQFLNELSLKLKNTEHAILKEFNGIRSVINTYSDVDLAMKKENAEKFINDLSTSGVISRSINRKSYMITLQLYFEDLSFVSLDFIHAFKRKTNHYLDVDVVLEKAYLGKDGLRYASPHCNTEYIVLFYKLNNAPIPEKYLKCFTSYPPTVFNHVSSYLHKKYGFSLNDVLKKDKETQSDLRKKLIKYEQDLPLNKSIIKKLIYFKDTVKELFNKAPIISFSGVDGAGKTTVLYTLKEILENKFRQKVVVIRHRPSILPILSAYVHGKEKASEISMSKLPRQGENKNLLSSLVRFTYYFLDYIIGQVIISFKYSRRGVVVIYDRYYYDFILDGIRSNINLPKWFVKPLFRFVKKPNLNFFLWASPEVILSRKKEMDPADILELTSEYKNLFAEFQVKYKVDFQTIENIELEETIEKIQNAYVHKIQRR